MAETRLEASLEMQVDQAIRALRQFRQQLGTEVPKAATQATQGLKKFEAAAANAQPTLVNFGRVVQDAPFGLIGIANNIDPLVTSFQTLKTQTGSTAAALRLLGGSLLGPAGIAIGISTVTSLLIAFGGKLFQSKEETESLADTIKKATKTTIEFGDAVGNEVVRAQTLIAFAGNATKSYADRKSAIDELRNIYPAYLKNISDEEILTGKSTAAVNALTTAIINNAIIKAQQENLGKEVTKIINEENQRIADQQSALALANGGLKNYANSLKSVKTVTKSFSLADVVPEFNAAGKAAQQFFGTLTPDAFNAQRLQAAIQPFINKIADLATGISDFGIKPDKDGKVKEFTQDLTKYQLTILDAETKQNAYGDAVLRTFQIEQRLSQLRKKETASQIDDLIANVNNDAIAKVAESYKQIPDAINKARADNKAFGDDIKKDLLDKINDVVTGFNAISPLIDQTFNALANGESVFDSLKQGVKRLIVDLLKAVALAAILSALPGGGATATGLTALIGKLLNFKGFRAGGGPVQSGGSYIVGEKGPELFVPENGGRIIPNSALMNGGGAMGGVLTARVEGSDLLFVLERAQRSAGRRR